MGRVLGQCQTPPLRGDVQEQGLLRQTVAPHPLHLRMEWPLRQARLRLCPAHMMQVIAVWATNARIADIFIILKVHHICLWLWWHLDCVSVCMSISMTM
jgi:hypothetical protein